MLRKVTTRQKVHKMGRMLLPQLAVSPSVSRLQPRRCGLVCVVCACRASFRFGSAKTSMLVQRRGVE
jgi:hypothetical protein